MSRSLEWRLLAGLRDLDAVCTCSDAQLTHVGCDCDAGQNMPVQCNYEACEHFLRSQDEINNQICERCSQ